MASTLATGAVFGAATVAAGVYSPSLIISQFKFEDWHMVQTFLGAAASSVFVYKVAEHLGYISLKPRSSSPLGIFSQYDGNIIGGLLLGAGMAISGSCPGTVLAQIGAGLQTGYYALGGALLGGIAYTGVVSKVIKWQREKTGVKSEVTTLSDQLGVSNTTVFLLFEVLAISALATTVLLGNGSSQWTLFSAGSGLFIGFAQLFSIVTRKSLLGASTSYEEAGNHFWWLLRGADRNSLPSSRQNMLFASGVAAGAWVLAQRAPELLSQSVIETEPGLAAAGGFLMVLGARIAGGCTSGHGISGMTLFSVSSVVTIVSTFLAGGLLGPLVHK